MKLHDSSTSTDDIIYLPRHFKYFKNEQFTSSYKSAIIRLFRIKINSKRRNLANNYIELIQYDKPIYKYDHNVLYKEFKGLPVGTDNWYSKISSKARHFI